MITEPSPSLILLFISIVYALANIRKENKSRFIILSILQIVILFLGYRENRIQNQLISNLKAEILNLKTELSEVPEKLTGLEDKTGTLIKISDINEKDTDVRDAIHALIKRNEKVAKETIKNARKSKELDVYLLYKAKTYLKTGDYEKSQIYFKLCDFLQDNPEVLFNLAKLEHILSGNEKKEEIVQLLKKALELEPGMIKAHTFLGQIFDSSGDWEEAELHFISASELAVDKGDAKKIEKTKINLAFFYLSKSQYKKAISQFEELINLNKEEADYLYHLSNCFYELKSYQTAKEKIDKALEIEPDNPDYLAVKIKILKNLEPSPPSPKKYPDIKATIVNACRNKKASNDLGFKLKKKYGIRYRIVTNPKLYENTEIYYLTSEEKTVAKELENIFPGKQKLAPLPRSVKLDYFREVVIFLGNDYREVLKF